MMRVLADEAPLAEVILRDEARVVPLGDDAAFTSRAVLRSGAMRRLIEIAHNAYDPVILDCAPAGTVGETRAVAPRSEAAAIIVAKWHQRALSLQGSGSFIRGTPDRS
jgi:Mrp family chromosome partitioning ATPase